VTVICDDMSGLAMLLQDDNSQMLDLIRGLLSLVRACCSDDQRMLPIKETVSG
jgi:hypothetical protein